MELNITENITLLLSRMTTGFVIYSTLMEGYFFDHLECESFHIFQCVGCHWMVDMLSAGGSLTEYIYQSTQVLWSVGQICYEPSVTIPIHYTWNGTDFHLCQQMHHSGVTAA